MRGMGAKKTAKLTAEQREEITRRVLAGEKTTDLGREFGVTGAYVSLLKNTALDPERFERKRKEKLQRKLTEAEHEELERIFANETPADRGLIPARERWSLDHGFQLAEKLFQKKPSVRAMKELMAPQLKRRATDWDAKPQPPQPRDVRTLSPEFAADPDFVAYYMSPIYEKIRWREYELALKDWEEREKRRAEREQVVPAEAEDPVFPELPQADPAGLPMPGRRTGKHAGSKGAAFTKPKRRKKRKRK